MKTLPILVTIFVSFSASASHGELQSAEIIRLSKNLPLEERTRKPNSVFDWETCLNTFSAARDIRQRSILELEHDRMFANYWKPLLKREPRSDGRILETLLSFNRQLEEVGVEFIFVWVPNPIDVHAVELSEGKTPEKVSIWPEMTRFQIKCLRNGINSIDLRPQFRKAALSGNEDNAPFERYDHHWSAAGVEIAASNVARIAAQFLKDQRSEATFSSRPRTIPRDTSKPHLLPKDFDPGDQLVREVLMDGKPFEPVPDSDLVVLGDSMVKHLSHSKPHGAAADFPAKLSAELGIPASVISQNGGGHMVPAMFQRDFLISKTRPLPKVVVWVLAGVVAEPDEWSNPSFVSMESYEKREAISDSASFLGLFQSLEPNANELIPVNLATDGDYGDAAIATRYRLVSSVDKQAPPNGSEMVVVQQIMQNRIMLAPPPFESEASQWMWVTSAATSEQLNPSRRSMSTFQSDEQPLELPRYWRD